MMPVRKFDSLEQRVVATYLETMPPFYPREDEVGPAAQKAFYDWMKGLYQLLLRQPELLFPSLHPDDFLTYRFNKSLDGKPKVQATMRAAQKRLDELLNKLIELAQGQMEAGRLTVPSAVKIPAAHRRVLSALGVQETRGKDTVCLDCGNAGLAEAWRWMATREDAVEVSRWVTREDVLRLLFSRCLFHPAHSYATDIFRPLFENTQAFERLVAFLEENGYERTDNRDGRVALDYAKEYGPKPSPLKDAWAERTHGGISLQYDWQMDEPACLCLRVPMLAELLRRVDEMDGRTRRFLVGTTKKCNGCRYCVQLDKTGKRPLASVPVTEGGQTVRLCPIFPGYTYCWTRLDDGLVDDLIAALTCFDRCFAK